MHEAAFYLRPTSASESTSAAICRAQFLRFIEFNFLIWNDDELCNSIAVSNCYIVHGVIVQCDNYFAAVNQVYDIPIDPSVYPNAGLTSISYVRTHKQIVVNEGEIANPISDLKAAYPDLYLSILEKREQFSAEITEQALG